MATKKRGRRAPAKKPRAPKFVQIAVTVDTNDGELMPYVYALDETGTVWLYDDTNDSFLWKSLSNARVAPDDEEM